MNTLSKNVSVRKGRRCDHVHMRVGETTIRLAQYRPPDHELDGDRRVLVGDCPVPRCDRVSVASLHS